MFCKLTKAHIRCRRFIVKLQTSDIRMTYEYIRITYEWHTDGIRVHTTNIRMGYAYINRIKDLELLDRNFQNCCKNIVLGFCKWFLATTPIPIGFMKILLSSTTGFRNLNNLKGGPYYILQPRSVLIFLIWSVADKIFYPPGKYM